MSATIIIKTVNKQAIVITTESAIHEYFAYFLAFAFSDFLYNNHPTNHSKLLKNPITKNINELFSSKGL